MNTFFSAQNLIFDITLCGDFAGAASVFAETCTGTCYNDYVVGDGSAYDNAYFEVQSVRVFGTSSDVVVSSSGAREERRRSWVGVVAGAGVAMVGGLWGLL